MIVTVTVLCVLAAAPARAAVCDVPSFGPPTNFVASDNPDEFAVGDFDRDGTLDLAVLNTASEDISILLGDGAGGFAAATTNLATGDSPSTIVTADFDLDGALDLAVPNFVADNVSIFLGDGAGGFGAGTTFAVGNQPSGVAVGDLDTDGDLDLAFVRLSQTTIVLLAGDGTGAFGAPTSVSLSGATGGQTIAAADLNRDGKLDLAVAGSKAGQHVITILTGNGAGAFTVAAAPVVATQIIRTFALGDLDRDGFLDVAVGATEPGGLTVALGDGAGSFGAPTSLVTGQRSSTAAIGDVNLDGIPDLVAGVNLSATLGVFLGDGTGAFDAPVTFATSSPIAIADLDRDGRPDIVGTINLPEVVRVQLSTCGDPVATPTAVVPTPTAAVPTPTAAVPTPTRTAIPTATPTPIVGLVPTDKVALACADTVTKNAAKLTSALLACHRKAATNAFRGKAFNEDACQATAVAKYDGTNASLFARKQCALCVRTNAGQLLTDIVATFEELKQKPYCLGAVPLP